MTGKVFPTLVALALSAGIGDRANAQSAPGAPDQATSTLPGNAARRYPQPVRTRDLAGRKLLGPSESQPVLGKVAGVSRDQDGRLALVVRIGGLFGLGSRLVAVPLDAVGLLGEHVALLDLRPEQLSALPALPEPARFVPDETILVGLVKPFH